MIFRGKNTIKDDISGIIEKDDTYLRKYGIFSDRKIKDDNKVYFYQKVPMIHCILWELLWAFSCIDFQ